MPNLCRCAYNVDCPVIELLNQDASHCVTNCPKKLLRPSASSVAVTKQPLWCRISTHTERNGWDA